MATPVPAAPSTQADPKATTQNITKAVTDKANGKGPEATLATGKAEVKTIDPNAGKEKVVVEGKEYWLTPEQIRVAAQKGIAFEPRISELGRLKQEQINFVNALMTNPGAVLRNVSQQMKVPMEKLVQNILQNSQLSDDLKNNVGSWYYENVVKPEKMSPEAREAFEAKRRIAELEERESKRTMDLTARENLARVQAAERQLKGQLSDALKEVTIVKNIDSPLGVMVAKRIFDVLRMSFLTKEPITAKKAAELVQGQMREMHKLHLDDLEPEALVEAIGKENAEKVRKFFLKAVKEAGKAEAKANASEGSAPRNGRKVMTEEEFKTYLMERKRNG